ncbi:MAG: type II toxin-antitoxin system VapC family toxin [Acidobacteriota bacterium]
MKKVVVDASVAIKWFVPEIHSEAAAHLLEIEIVLCAPDLIFPEFGNILWKKVRRGEISREEADEILAAFSAIPLDIHPSSVLLAGAFELAVELDRSVYDSLYLALAVAESCVLVTADRKFHTVVTTSSVANHVLWVEEEI